MTKPVSHSENHQQTHKRWSVIFWISFVVGALTGYYFTFEFSYWLSDEFKVISFPLPCAFNIHELQPDGTKKWGHFITHSPLFNAMINFTFFTCLIPLCVWFAKLIHRRITH